MVISHGHSPLFAWMMPTITPNKPNALPKISMISILTKVDGVYASASAQPAPTTPTQTPHTKFDKPTDNPAPKKAYPAFNAFKFLLRLILCLLY